jgi:LysR family cyn operon transcriptional activator
MLKTGETGILRVGATPQVIENLLAGFLIHYRQRHPGVEVHFVEDGGVRLHGPLERGDVHLTMTAAAATRFHDRLLYPMHLVAVVAAGHQLSRRAVLEITELADEPLLLTASGFGSREWFDAACQVAQIRPRVLLESAAPATLVALAAVDYAIAVLPSNAHVPRGAVRAVPLVYRGASLGRWAHIAWDRSAFWRPMPNSLWTSSPPIAGASFPAASSSGAHRACRLRRDRSSDIAKGGPRGRGR